jgi:hypothetical protein
LPTLVRSPTWWFPHFSEFTNIGWPFQIDFEKVREVRGQCNKRSVSDRVAAIRKKFGIPMGGPAIEKKAKKGGDYEEGEAEEEQESLDGNCGCGQCEHGASEELEENLHR